MSRTQCQSFPAAYELAVGQGQEQAEHDAEMDREQDAHGRRRAQNHEQEPDEAGEEQQQDERDLHAEHRALPDVGSIIGSRRRRESDSLGQLCQPRSSGGSARSGTAGRPMGADVDQPGHEKLAVGIDHAGFGRSVTFEPTATIRLFSISTWFASTRPDRDRKSLADQ